MYSSKSLQLCKAIIFSFIIGMAIGCQKGSLRAVDDLQDDASIITQKPIIVPYTDVDDSQIPVMTVYEEEAPPTDEGAPPERYYVTTTTQAPPPKTEERPIYVTTTTTSTTTTTLPAPPKEKDESWVPKGMKSEDFAEASQMNPTIYYHPVIKDAADRCEENARVNLITADDKALIKICKVDADKCSMQGTCTIVSGDKRRTFNHHIQKNGVDRFFELDSSECIYGYGVGNICLDPFFSVAADLSIYRPGSVIFVPSVRGMLLPGGQKHDGFFVVRDRGGGVKGPQRFDFFTGSYSWISKNNPFAQLGLGNPRSPQKFFVVTSKEARNKALEKRNFPVLP